LLLFVVLAFCAAEAEPLPLRRAIELAVANSSVMAQAHADQVSARHSYLEARNTFLPQMVFGSGLAGSWGFPLSIEGSAPSIFNVNSQQFLLNFAQRDFIRAARREWTATSLLAQDKRAEVILETTVTYMQLDYLHARLNVLRQQELEAGEAVQITSERVSEGVDSSVELTKAKLVAARTRLQSAQAQGSAEFLRERLTQLTGLPARSIETVTESIPKLPEVRQEEDLRSKALQTSTAIRIAEERTASKELRARGEHKQRYPAIDLVGQYGLFSKFNNYDEFYQRFQRHNATVGVAIRVPFLNPSQSARANSADAEALAARKEATAVRHQVAANTLKLQRAVEQVAAARDVAQLEFQLAQANLEIVDARVQAGQATLRDQHNARVEMNARYGAFLDTNFELDKARVQLLQATGELEKWAME
jgi:outer membrane protein TolC